MIIGNYKHKDKSFIGIRQDDRVFPVNELLKNSDNNSEINDIQSFILTDENVIAKIKKDLDVNRETTESYSVYDLKELTPIQNPPKNVICVGRNYIEHVEEGDRASGEKIGAPLKPIFFSKSSNTITGPDDDILYHNCTNQLDYEAELAIVIGKKGKNIDAKNVNEYIFGYTILNDVTARDLQDEHSQWFKGKNLDTFCPIGPHIVTKDEFDLPINLNIELTVNGEVRQSMNTTEMIFDIPTIVAEISKGMTLEVGDIIATGTGPGCGFGFNPPKFIKENDVVEIDIEKIGKLTNTVRKDND